MKQLLNALPLKHDYKGIYPDSIGIVSFNSASPLKRLHTFHKIAYYAKITIHYLFFIIFTN